MIPTGKGGLAVYSQTPPPKSWVSTNANSETMHGIWESHRLGEEDKYTASYIT